VAPRYLIPDQQYRTTSSAWSSWCRQARPNSHRGKGRYTLFTCAKERKFKFNI